MGLNRFLAKIFFNLIWVPWRLVFWFFLHYKIEGKENLKDLKPPVLIVINHASWLDPFLAADVFPFNSKFYPIHYACWYVYYYLFFPFLFLLGVFPVRKGIGLENALKIAVKILQKGGTVGIFPEGQRYRQGQPRKIGRGAAYLALTLKIPVLPIKIEGLTGFSSGNFLLRKNKIIARAGKIFYLPEEMTYPDSINQATDFIAEKMDSV